LSKKIKVQLTSKKSAYVIERQIYRPGDIFEIDETRFDVSCMVKIEEPKKKPPKKPEVAEEPIEELESTEETTVVEEVTSEVIVAQAAPKVRKRKV
jgi:hypothetical protein